MVEAKAEVAAAQVFEIVGDGKLQVWSDSVRLGEDGNAALVSLFGARAAVKAVWAKLADRVALVRIGTIQVRLDKEIAYVTQSAPLGKDVQHTVITHPTMSPLRTGPGPFLVPAGPDVVARFFARLDTVCPVPFRAAWGAALWDAGLNGRTDAAWVRPIRALHGFGLDVWTIDPDPEVWHKIVATLLEQKVIS